MFDLSDTTWADWREQVEEPTREAWLEQALRVIAPAVWSNAGVDLGADVPARVSVGFPITGGRGAKRIGECWHGAATADNVPQIFVHPSVAEGKDALAVLVHELIHAALGPGCGHKGPFRACALKLGLTGPMTATVPGDVLTAQLAELMKHLGPYPHAKLNTADRKRQKTYLLKAACAKDGYTIRLTEKWASVGLPQCPMCSNLLKLEETK